MLAYVFWRRPAGAVDRDACESAQRSCHDRLNAVGSEGFIRSSSFRVEGTVQLPGGVDALPAARTLVRGPRPDHST